MIALSEIREELLAEGLDDCVGLWELPWILRRRDADCMDDEVREQALEIVGSLLREELMESGALQENGEFVAWTCTPEEVLARIDREWRDLGQDPSIGQVCWLSITALGDKAARWFSNQVAASTR